MVATQARPELLREAVLAVLEMYLDRKQERTHRTDFLVPRLRVLELSSALPGNSQQVLPHA